MLLVDYSIYYPGMSEGILIDLEGGDGSGKATQANLLLNRLQSENHKAELFSFPRYTESRAGELIGELLTGVHGDFMGVPPYLSALPYTLDRASARDKLRALLKNGVIVVADRYTPSNIAHQSAKLSVNEQENLAQFIEALEYEDLAIPKPDLVLYLSVPTDIATELVAQKGQREYLGGTGRGRDLAERNLAHQDRTRKAYLRFADLLGWRVVDCVKEGILRSPQEIHNDVWGEVCKLLPVK